MCGQIASLNEIVDEGKSAYDLDEKEIGKVLNFLGGIAQCFGNNASLVASAVPTPDFSGGSRHWTSWNREKVANFQAD